jgi:hypothetical protein
MSWENASRLADKHGAGSGVFVRLTKDGDKVTGAFVGEPHAREVVWTGEKYETYDPAVHKERPLLRVSINLYVPSEGAMKIIEGGSLWFKDVLKVREKYGLDKWLFEIERHGDAGNPKTKYSILPDRKIEDDDLEKIAQLELNDLAGGHRGSQADSGFIENHVAEDFRIRLRSLDRTLVAEILKKLGVQKVAEIKKADEQRARNLIADQEIPF